MNLVKHSPINEFKIKASILLKSLKSNDSSKVKFAIKRFKKLPEYSVYSENKILDLKSEIKLKHALKVIALENNYNSWSDLKHSLEMQYPEFNRELFYTNKSGGFLNNWYSNYDEAKECLDKSGGFLLVYKNHFFVCLSTYIDNLGLNPNDHDWKKIGYDWEKPKDIEAWKRLYNKLVNLNK